jgi:hypothetical protein
MGGYRHAINSHPAQARFSAFRRGWNNLPVFAAWRNASHCAAGFREKPGIIFLHAWHMILLAARPATPGPKTDLITDHTDRTEHNAHERRQYRRRRFA